ncbi:MAG TPA: hypothetical protein DEB17_05105 [Chlorobaculum sp.]|uniref:Uncharacterized protein n=1 Tax=Chlorobaculum tepidum (strain ATCC 49652 / DSM 12025 / NBRC 103806 / TLS) TaxID=194439 RepID=Q8KAX0_CHLTE|nr:hypothetical protein CT2031 [Chlorobaculum tepidum TLS]HBU23362.1 hypothetical protein [Chlorobaculum sp.]
MLHYTIKLVFVISYEQGNKTNREMLFFQKFWLRRQSSNLYEALQNWTSPVSGTSGTFFTTSPAHPSSSTLLSSPKKESARY